MKHQVPGEKIKKILEQIDDHEPEHDALIHQKLQEPWEEYFLNEDRIVFEQQSFVRDLQNAKNNFDNRLKYIRTQPSLYIEALEQSFIETKLQHMKRLEQE